MLVRWLKPSYPSVYAGLSKVLKSELNSKASAYGGVINASETS